MGREQIVNLAINRENVNAERPTSINREPASNIESEQWEERRYSTDYGNAETGFTLGELTPKHFSFNSHLGACPACHGLGTQLVCDPDLMISDPGRTLAEGAITPWRRGTKRMQAYYRHLQKALVKHFHVDEDVPFSDLPEQFKQALRSQRFLSFPRFSATLFREVSLPP